MALAAEHARQRGHDYVGTEHLLLGLLDEPDGIAGQVLARVAGLEAVRARVQAILASPGYRGGSSPVPRG
jgi:ATP-dependent Clp protease ATP-binding subunit ClpC